MLKKIKKHDNYSVQIMHDQTFKPLFQDFQFIGTEHIAGI